MPMHDWSRDEASIYHHFHHEWISEISRVLNKGLLPPDYYAMAEQQAAGFGPNEVTLQGAYPVQLPSGGTLAATLVRPQTPHFAESQAEFHRRRKSSIAVRHVSGDKIVAMVEIVSPGSKSSGQAFHAFVERACELLEHRIHMLLLDPFPPGPRDPNGIHAAIWSRVEAEAFVLPPHRPLTMVSYECDFVTRAYIETIATGEPLPSMPLFLGPNNYVNVPLEDTYDAAWDAVSPRWQRVVAASANGNL